MSDPSPSPPTPPAVAVPEFVARVTVKLPDFWTADPDLWFLHAESAFRSSRIVDSRTKYDIIVQKLPQDIMVSVRPLVKGSAATSSTPLRGPQGQAGLLLHSHSLAAGGEGDPPPWVGGPTPDRPHGRHAGPAP